MMMKKINIQIFQKKTIMIILIICLNYLINEKNNKGNLATKRNNKNSFEGNNEIKNHKTEKFAFIYLQEKEENLMIVVNVRKVV